MGETLVGVAGMTGLEVMGPVGMEPPEDMVPPVGVMVMVE